MAAKTSEEAWQAFDDEHMKDSVYEVWNAAYELGRCDGTAPNTQSDAMLSLRDCVELISSLTKCDDGSLLPPIERGKFNRAKDVIAHAHV